MTDTFRKILCLLDERERRQFWLLNVVMVFVALAEVGSVSAVLFLLNVLAKPEVVQQSALLSATIGWLGLTTPLQINILLAGSVTLVVVAGLALKALGSYAVTHFAYMRTYSLSARLLGSYLRQPYAWFLERNTSEIGKNVLGEVDGLVIRVLYPLVKMLSNIMLVVAILGFLVVVDPIVTILSSVLLGGSYAAIYLMLRGKMRDTGEDMMQAYAARFRVAQEATGGIKDVKLMGLEETYVDRYGTAARRTAQATVVSGLIGEMPRYALEAITFGTLLVLVLVLLVQKDGQLVDVVPTLGIFAFSVMRLLPAVQQIYHGFASIRSASAVLDALVADYTSAPIAAKTAVAGDVAPIRLDAALELRDVSFRYPTALRPSVNDLNLTIPARTTVGLVGGTGAGKTTLVDLILGLLTPDSGEICVDGTVVTEANRRGWQRTLGYVPQSIYLTDDSIAANIAFGVDPAQIDMAAVERAARAAAMHDFVTTELPEAYATIVGERGVRLSGGQRQRIGIARALYHTPSLLIMDEATSALDNITERVVMEAVQNIRADTTVILIAHRLTTVKDCDRIFLLEKGRIAAAGTYDELVAGNETFREMAVGS